MQKLPIYRLLPLEFKYFNVNNDQEAYNCENLDKIIPKMIENFCS